jgi:transcriptional regulator with XRE-family HTH domain
MKEENDERAFNEALRVRLKALRDGKGWTAEEMADALGIPPERYRKYESRSPVPQYLIPRIALIMDKSIEFVLTGKDKKPSLSPRPAAAQEKRRA